MSCAKESAMDGILAIKFSNGIPPSDATSTPPASKKCKTTNKEGSCKKEEDNAVVVEVLKSASEASQANVLCERGCFEHNVNFRELESNLQYISTASYLSLNDYVEADKHFDFDLEGWEDPDLAGWKPGFIMTHDHYVYEELPPLELLPLGQSKSIHLKGRKESANSNDLLEHQGFYKLNMKNYCTKNPDGGLEWDHQKLVSLQTDERLSSNQRVAAKELVALHGRALKYDHLLKQSEVPLGQEGDHGVPVAVGGADTASNLYYITPEDHTLTACLEACLFANKPLSDTIRFFFKGSQHPQLVNARVSQFIQRRETALLNIITQAHFSHIQSNGNNKWNERLEKLKKYKEENGDCIVTGNSYLTRWVQKQRTLCNNGQLSKDRQDALNAIGFVWQGERDEASYKNQWNQRLAELKAEMADQGACPRAENPVLRNWVATQRRQCRKGHLSEDRQDALNAIGFTWESKFANKK